MVDETRAGRGARAFEALGRSVVRHPWRYIAFWIVLLIVTLPFLQYIGGITTNSTSTLPSSAPSSIAQAEFDRLFPNDTGGGSSSYLLFTGANLTDAPAQGTILNVTSTLRADTSLRAIASIDSVYTGYASYLSGQLLLASNALQSALTAPNPLPDQVNATSLLLWGVPAYYLTAWETLVDQGSAPAAANYPAYQNASAAFSSNATELALLNAFYAGVPPNAGFNGTGGGCASAPTREAVIACADTAARTNEPSVVATLYPPPSPQYGSALTVLSTLGTENYTSAPSLRFTTAAILGTEVGYPASWILATWSAFPHSVPSTPEADRWSNATVANVTLWTEPLPVPYSISSGYVAPRGTAQLIDVSFTVADDSTNGSGGNPVQSDVNAMNRIVPGVVRSSDVSIAFVQTGPAPLDYAQSSVVNSAIALVLPITVAVLILVTALYFRSPITPLVAFAGLSIALVLGLGGTLLLGTLVTHVDTTSLTLEEVFVLGVGTDYAIFLISRYREERVAGVSSNEAIVTSVTWAGQSVATSGTTALIATLALTFSGVALLSQWGMVLSFAILVTILLSLTMIPALLTIIGPRVFWPYTRGRFDRAAARQRARLDSRSTYFYRVAAFTQRRPLLAIGVILLVSIPLVFYAIGVPLSYDYYQQLPASQPAVAGLNTLGQEFGNGFAFPTSALVTFSSPIIVGNQTNATEFAQLAALTSLAAGTSGIAAVQSLVGPYGAPLATWQNLSSAPPATQKNLEGLADSFVGIDHRTVLLNLQTNVSGLSAQAIGSINSVESAFGNYQSHHRDITGLAYLGGGPVTSDLANQAAEATERLFIAVAIALLVVLFVVLRSAILPVLAVATIGLSIAWAWALTYLVLTLGAGIAIFFFVPTLMFILILGLGIDYNIFLLTRVREERLKGRSSADASAEALARTGGIITAAAIILAGAFATLMVGDFDLLIAIGFSVAIAVILDAMVVRTFLVPSVLQILGERTWQLPGRRRKGNEVPLTAPSAPGIEPDPAKRP